MRVETECIVVSSSMTDSNHLTGELILEYNDNAVRERLIGFIVIPIQRQLLPGVDADKKLVFVSACVNLDATNSFILILFLALCSVLIWRWWWVLD